MSFYFETPYNLAVYLLTVKSFYQPPNMSVFVLIVNIEMEIYFTCTAGLNLTSESWLSRRKSSDRAPLPTC